MKCFPKIIVSWHSANGDSVSKHTFVHAYQLATDYQMISQVSDIEPVDHYVSSLHNIEGMWHFPIIILLNLKFLF